MSPGAALLARWRETAKNLRGWGAVAQAETLERCATELETDLREWEAEALTLEQAAHESGYSYSTVQHMVRRGELENIGNKHRPRVRRGHLPRKARRESPDLAGAVIAGRIGATLDKRGSASHNA